MSYAALVVAIGILGYLLIRDRREIGELVDRQINERSDWLIERRQLRDSFAAERLAWREERSELMTRVQHPEIVVGQAQHREIDDEEMMTVEMDEIDKVGTIERPSGDEDHQ